MNSIVKNTKVVTTTTTTVELSAEAQKALEAFITAKETIKALEEQKALAEEILRDAFGDAEAVTIDGKIVAKMAQRVRKGTDSKALEQDFPEAYEATLKVSPYSFIQNL